MAGPIADKVILPLDTGNTGKKVRTQTRVIGADTVHEHFFIQTSRRKIEGIYNFAATAPASVQATAQNGTATGFFWLELPVGGTRRARLRDFKVTFDWGVVPSADVTTLPRIAVARFTFTGTASGALITPARSNSSSEMTANVANIRTAVTGMTVTVGAIAWSALAPFIDFATAAGINVQPRFTEYYDPDDEEAYLDFGPGEGLLLYQPDAGTASDIRRFNYWGRWDEYDNA